MKDNLPIKREHKDIAEQHREITHARPERHFRTIMTSKGRKRILINPEIIRNSIIKQTTPETNVNMKPRTELPRIHFRPKNPMPEEREAPKGRWIYTRDLTEGAYTSFIERLQKQYGITSKHAETLIQGSINEGMIPLKTFKLTMEALKGSKYDNIDILKDFAKVKDIYEELKGYHFINKLINQRPDVEHHPYDMKINIEFDPSDIYDDRYQVVRELESKFPSIKYIRASSTLYDTINKEFVTIITDPLDLAMPILTYRNPDLEKHELYIERIKYAVHQSNPSQELSASDIVWSTMREPVRTINVADAITAEIERKDLVKKGHIVSVHPKVVDGSKIYIIEDYGHKDE